MDILKHIKKEKMNKIKINIKTAIILGIVIAGIAMTILYLLMK